MLFYIIDLIRQLKKTNSYRILFALIKRLRSDFTIYIVFYVFIKNVIFYILKIKLKNFAY